MAKSRSSRCWKERVLPGWRGQNRESAQRDLFSAIELGDHPNWRVCVQVMPEKEAETYHLNPFDSTKVPARPRS